MEFERLVTDARDCAWQQLMRNSAEDLRLYYAPSGPGRWGEVLVSATAPEDALLASPERVPSHLDRDQLRRWIRERCTVLPLLPEEALWIRVPYPGWYDGDERFYRVISRHAWGELSRGKDLSPYRPVEHRQIYNTRGLESLGTWSGWVDEHGFLRDDALLEDSPLCPF